MQRGIFISFEGADGTGKTTQSMLLAEFLRSKQYKIILTREPGGTLISDKIRQIILDNNNYRMTTRTELLLYAAARAQHVEEKIRPLLFRGEIVITDRFCDSTYVYQGLAGKIDIREVNYIINFATLGLKPDITIILECDSSISEQRIQKRKQNKNRLESVSTDFIKNVHEGFKKLVKIDPKRFKLINTNNSAQNTQKEIQKIIKKFFKKVNLK